MPAHVPSSISKDPKLTGFSCQWKPAFRAGTSYCALSVLFVEIEEMRPYTVSRELLGHGWAVPHQTSKERGIKLPHNLCFCPSETGKGQSYPATSLVVLQVHQHARLLLRAPHVVLLPLLGIHKLLGEAVPVLHVIPAAAPQPVSGQVLGPGSPAAATAGELSLAASPADGVHHPGSADGIGESSLSATCRRMQGGN